MSTWTIRFAVGVLGFAAMSTVAHADIAVLLEEPYGLFGKMNPTGHAAIYLNKVCASSPSELRACKSGELGVVISRYHRIAGYDWMAIPLIPYLYAVDDPADMPKTADLATATKIQDAYWRKNLSTLIPSEKGDEPPPGEWRQLVGASYIRKIDGVRMKTTAEQDEAFIAMYNDRRNNSHFNIIYRNCADFSRTVINTYYPGAIHRSILGDAGITTPKQVAKSLVKYGKQHPELNPTAFVIPQVPGSIPRSKNVDGVTESVIKSKKYVLPLAVLAPIFTGTVLVTYLTEDRFTFPKDATVETTPGLGQDVTGMKAAPAGTAPAAAPVAAPVEAPDMREKLPPAKATQQ